MPSFEDFGTVQPAQPSQPKGQAKSVSFNDFVPPQKRSTQLNVGKIHQQGEAATKPLHISLTKTNKQKTLAAQKKFGFDQKKAQDSFDVARHMVTEYTSGAFGQLTGYLLGLGGKAMEAGEKSKYGNVDAITGRPPIPHVDVRNVMSKFGDALTFDSKSSRAKKMEGVVDTMFFL